ncbi:MAG: Ig-like domain repeat protein [Chloroflexota bacterium]
MGGNQVRRLALVLALALVSTLVPWGRAPAIGADPGQSPAPEATTPDASPGQTVEPAVEPSVAPTALTPTVTYIYNPPQKLVVDQPYTLQAHVSHTVDGGTLTIAIDGVPLETKPVASPGFTTFAWTPTVLGTVVVTATYSGSSLYAGSTSDPAVIEIIPPYPSGITVSAPWSVVRNTPFTMSSTVSPDPGPGTVDFYVDGVLVASGSLVAGTATAETSIAGVGLHGIVARFTGNADWSPVLSDWARVTVVGDAVVLDVTVPSDPLPAGPVTATATLSVDPGGGVIRWGWGQDSYTYEVAVGPGGVTLLDLGTVATGWHDVYVQFPGFGTWGPATDRLTFKAAWATSTTLQTSRTTATIGELPVVLKATVVGQVETATTVTFLDDVAGVVVELGPVPVDAYSKEASLSSSGLRVGLHTITARYNGGDWSLPSTSGPVTVTVARDTAVHATFKPSRGTFYPYKDGLWDAVSLGGALDERATVTIKVYNSRGTLKRTWSLGSRGPGAYAATWNGKTASGTKLPAGKYRAKALFKDARGNTRTITTYVTLSWRQATWKSVSVTRYGDQFAYYAPADGHLFYSNDYSRGVVLFSAYINRDCDPNCIEVSGTTTFGLNSTAPAVRSVKIRVAGHGYEDYNSGTAFFWRWGEARWASHGSLPYYYGSTETYPVASAEISADRKVRLSVWCTEDMGDAFDLHYATLTYQYAVWR